MIKKQDLFTLNIIIMGLRAGFIFFFWIIISLIVSGQVGDDFTDGEIHTNPAWSGDTSLFWVVDPGNSGDGSLAAGANDDGKVLSSKPDINDAVITVVSSVAAGEWLFSVADGAGWSLSGTNNYNIILVSDENDVSKLKDGSFDFNGYFLNRGCSSCDDPFELYRQDGTISTLILNTNYPSLPDGSGSESGHTIKVCRSNGGIWEVYIDEGFDTVPSTMRGVAVLDTIHSTSACFAISTNISNASAKRVLYFDNLSINNNSTTTLLPPTGLSIEHIAPDKMNLIWTKPGGVYGTDWHGVIVFAREGAPNDAVMNNSDAADYLPNVQYALGTQSNNSFCVVNQNSDSDGDVVVSGLLGGKSYYFIAYAYREIAGSGNDGWSVATTEVGDTAVVQGVVGFWSDPGRASAMLGWTNYTNVHGTWWDEVMIVGSLGAVVDQSPLGNGVNYFADPNFGAGSEVGGSGTGNFVVYKGVEDSVLVLGLINDSLYYFRAFVRYDTNWTEYGEYLDTSAVPSEERIFISEIADPLNNHNARFIEIYNAGDVCVDLNTNSWHLCKQTNGSNWSDLSLTGKIYPGCTFVISYNTSDFVSSYFFQPDQVSAIVSGNGDDGYFLYKNGDHQSGSLVDSYGLINQNGSGAPWEYTDSRVVRKDTIHFASPDWDNGEWIIYPQSTTNDMEAGKHRSLIKWQGSVSGNWNDGANWSGGNIPDTTLSVLVPETTGYFPVINGSSTCFDLTLSPLARLNVNINGILDVKNNVRICSDQYGAASIITEDSNDVMYGNKLTIERYFTSNDKWHYVSSPINDCKADIFTGSYLNIWNESQQLWEHIVDPFYSLNITEGYSVNLPVSFGGNVSFETTSGSLNSGTYFSKILTNTSGLDPSLNGYNLIGNPYPSSVDWDLVNIPSSIDAAIYYWDPSAGLEGSYKSYVPGIGGSGPRYIPPMHGFFIHASNTVNGQRISFDNSVRTHTGQSTSYKKGSIKELLKLEVCSNGYCDATYLNFSDQATIGFDSEYDAYKLFTHDTMVPQIFSRISNATLSVNSMPLGQKGVVIPLGFKSGSSGIFTISLNQISIFNPSNHIVLKDIASGILTDLSKSRSYTFSYQKCDDPNRFLLYVNYFFQDDKNNTKSSLVTIRTEQNKVYIGIDGRDAVAEIWNLLGQRLGHFNISGDGSGDFIIKEKPGVYLLRIICGDEVISEKIVIP